MRSKVLVLLCLILASPILATACSPLTIPSTSPDDIATIVVATQRAIPSVTPSATVPPSNTPPPTPTRTPTLEPTPVRGTPESAVRIFLRRGASSADISGHLEPGESQAFVLKGAQLQPLLVRLDSDLGDARFSLMSQGGTFFVRPGVQAFWYGSLPRTEDYYFGVYGGAAPQDFTLSVQLATRIKFKEGAAAATVGGRTVDGTTAVYSVLGQKDERMVVTISRAGRNAALSITGFVDRKQYLGSVEGKTTFILELPATQDYIIEVTPTDGQAVDFILDVEIR